MNEDKFWELIASSLQAAPDVTEVPTRLSKMLVSMPTENIFLFAHEFDRACRRAYDWRLWAAATVICGYCSNDVFSDFRSWLIAHGRSVFDRAIIDPDSLAALNDFHGDDGEGCLGTFASVAFDAYEAKTGRTDFWEQIPSLPPSPLMHRDAWDGKPETLEQIVPRLFAKFGRKA